jgi:cellulose synthase/poly-beta-1,6-N-acetylglucosamine synthase-like glycosyltransferase
MAEILFWGCLVLIVQTYILYPLTVAILKSLIDAPPPASAAPEPAVSVVIAVYNEENCIRERIDNVLSADYPGGKIDVLIGSDGSTDGTNGILRSHGASALRPFLFAGRRGKAGVLNDLVKEARGEIIVFSDANTEFTPSTISELVKPFADPAVGAVTGELILHSAYRNVGAHGEVSYWRFENWLKHAESTIRSTLGASGGVYAIRSSLWRELPYQKSIVDDFVIPMNVLKAGRVVKYNRSARAFERAAGSIRGEFTRKVRIGASNFNGIPEYAELLNPRHGFVAFALWSHKILRWFVPFLLVVFAVAAFALRGESPFHEWVVRLIALFALAALAGMAAEKFRWRVGIFGYPYYFIAMNLALLLGFFRSIAGKQPPVWEVVR